MIRFLLRSLAGKNFSNPKFSTKTLAKHFILQKILGFNRQVRWPVHPTTKIICPEKIQEGSRSPGMSMGCHIDGRNGIEFGENVWVGPRVTIISMNHDVNDFEKYEDNSPIIIPDNCWLGANSVILPAVELGRHTIVAAGCVVASSFPEGNQVLAGVPAKKVKDLPPYKGR